MKFKQISDSKLKTAGTLTHLLTWGTVVLAVFAWNRLSTDPDAGIFAGSALSMLSDRGVVILMLVFSFVVYFMNFIIQYLVPDTSGIGEILHTDPEKISKATDRDYQKGIFLVLNMVSWVNVLMLTAFCYVVVCAVFSLQPSGIFIPVFLVAVGMEIFWNMFRLKQTKRTIDRR